MHATVTDEVAEYLDQSVDRVMVGNWMDRQLLAGRSFDVVLADYLLGSVDHFAPHFQFDLLRRLSALLRPNGWLAIIGKEPEDLAADDAASRLVLDADALRDASMLLGRQRPYREMPRWWVAERLRGLGLKIHQTKLFPRLVTKEKVLRQLAWAEEELEKVPHGSLRAGLLSHLEDLRAQVHASADIGRGHPFGQDYALLVQRSAA